MGHQKKLYDRNNFNGLMEVIGALNNIAVQRMKSTWEIVMQKCKSKWEYLNDLMDSANNYKKYRDTLAECTLPCVPFLGLSSPFFQKKNFCSYWKSEH
jgi:hypothetical protein